MVAVACDLDQQFVQRKPADKETKTEKAQREFIENEFDVPGDYRIELYAKLTCNYYFILQLSYLPPLLQIGC